MGLNPQIAELKISMNDYFSTIILITEILFSV